MGHGSLSCWCPAPSQNTGQVKFKEGWVLLYRLHRDSVEIIEEAGSTMQIRWVMGHSVVGVLRPVRIQGKSSKGGEGGFARKLHRDTYTEGARGIAMQIRWVMGHLVVGILRPGEVK